MPWRTHASRYIQAIEDTKLKCPPFSFSYKGHINAMKDISLSTHGGHTFDMGDNRAMAMRDRSWP